MEDRPGVTERVLSTHEAMEVLRGAVRNYRLTVVAVAGPGEPLANRETFEVLEMAKEEFPDLIRCLATNGLALHENAQLLEEIGVSTVTVTVNTVDPVVGAKIYEYVNASGVRYSGEEGAQILMERQLQGIKEISSKGIFVKINTVLIPEINGDCLGDVAMKCSEMGAKIMNIVPLIPVGKFADERPPTCEELSSVRFVCEKHLEQFRVCEQCRADACGIPGRNDL